MLPEDESEPPMTMETKHLRSRRPTHTTSIHPPSLNEEVLEPCNRKNEKNTVIDNDVPTLVKRTTIGLVKPSLKKDRKFLKKKLLISSPETALMEGEVITIGGLCNNLNSLKVSSTDSKNVDNFPQKRPLKLAPLDLPAQVKEAQMKKIATMADSVYVNEQKPSRLRVHTPYRCLTKRDQLQKIRMEENKLPRLPEDIVSTKDNVLIKSSSAITKSFPRDLLLVGPRISMMKAESRHVNDSTTKTLSSNQ